MRREGPYNTPVALNNEARKHALRLTCLETENQFGSASGCPSTVQAIADACVSCNRKCAAAFDREFASGQHTGVQSSPLYLAFPSPTGFSGIALARFPESAGAGHPAGVRGSSESRRRGLVLSRSRKITLHRILVS